MIALLMAALLAGAPDSLRLVVSGRDSAIPVRAEGQTSFVAAEAVATALGGRVQRLPNHRYLLSLGGVVLEVADRVPFALADGRLYPLVVAVRERDGRLEVPIQLLTDIAPRAGAQLSWDPARRQLSPRVATRVTARPTAKPDAAVPAPVAPPTPAV
ncbi:MAG: hypothetical protein FJ363_12285, partial [Gemmatimonadetes bacterium]|nr:hypothetical protein [Gemmatimonadota bacterium]